MNEWYYKLATGLFLVGTILCLGITFACWNPAEPLTPEAEVHAAFDVDQAIQAALADMETRLYGLVHGQGAVQQELREVVRENEHLDRRVDNSEIGDGAMRATVQGLVREVQELKGWVEILKQECIEPPAADPAANSGDVPPLPTPADLEPEALEEIQRTLLRLYMDEIAPPTPQGLRR